MSVTDALTVALLRSLWQDAFIWCGLWLALVVLRNRSAQARYLACSVGLTTMALWPVLTLVAVAAPHEWMPPTAQPSDFTARVFADVAAFVPGGAPGTDTSPVWMAWVAWVRAWAVPLWLAGMLTGSVRVAIAGSFAATLARSGHIADDAMTLRVSRLAGSLGISRVVRVRLSRRAEAPATLGWMRPLILVPVSMATGMPGPQLEALLAHELAHIRRADFAVNAAQMLIETVFFYHPAVWWVSNRMRIERELCCDDVAVEACGDAAAYAQALAAVARVAAAPVRLAVGAQDGPLLQRVQRLVDRRGSRGGPSDSAASLWAVIVATSLVVTGAVVWARQVNGQAPAPPEFPTASFDVASVKRDTNPAAQMGIRPVNASGRVSAVITVRALIQVAYGYPLALLEGQVVGGPAWVSEDRFEINAVASPPLSTPDGRPVRVLAMMRALLEERFKLRLRKDTRQLPVYDLVVSRQDGRLGPRLSRADGQCVPMTAMSATNPDYSRGCGFRRFSPTSISVKGMDLEEVAGGLQGHADVQRVVRNRTGLTQRFDLDLDFTPFAGGAGAPDGPSLFTALKEQLGLELRPATGPVDVLVIDHVEAPSPD